MFSLDLARSSIWKSKPLMANSKLLNAFGAMGPNISFVQLRRVVQMSGFRNIDMHDSLLVTPAAVASLSKVWVGYG